MMLNSGVKMIVELIVDIKGVDGIHGELMGQWVVAL